MQSIFVSLVNVNIAACWAILAVILLRLVLKLVKAPSYIMNILWAIIGLRLVMPFSITSVFSLIPSVNTLPTDIMQPGVPQIHTGIENVNIIIQPIVEDIVLSAPQTRLNPIQLSTIIASIVWIVGVAVMIIYAVICCLMLLKKLKAANKLCDNIYTCNGIAGAFVFGLPAKIYVSSLVKNEYIDKIILHEKAHIKRKDHIIKPIAYFLLCVNWYNPLVWVAYIMLCRDIEWACDQRVIKNMNTDERADYSQALLDCSCNTRTVLMCPVAFGEVSVKSRIKGVLSYKKPTAWVIIAALCACMATMACFLTDPLVGDAGLVPTERPSAQEQTSERDIYVSQKIQVSQNHKEKKEFTVDGIDGKTFSCYDYKLYEVINGQYHRLFDENNNGLTSMQHGYLYDFIYIADVTGDGNPDFCFTTNVGFGMVTNHITVFDYVNKKEYILGVRMKNDYNLIENNGILYANSINDIGKLRFGRVGGEQIGLYVDSI